MVHNYLIQFPTRVAHFAIDVGTAVNSGFASDGIIKYHGKINFYIDTSLANAENLQIRESLIVAQWTSET